MAGGDGEVFHPRVFSRLYPVICVEQYRVKLFIKIIIILLGDLPTTGPPDFGTSQTYRPPMNEHTKAFIHKSPDNLRICMDGFIVRLGVQQQAAERTQYKDRKSTRLNYSH